jgi:ankyrin repeat protein
MYTVYLQTTGWTALFLASKKGNVKIVRLLIARGAQVNLLDKVSN